MSNLLNRLKQLWKRCRNAMTSSSSITDIYWLRWAVQAGFVLFTLLLGLQFRTFMKAIGQASLDVEAVRPAAVEGYLPISSLMSLVYFLKTGIANAVHPAGLVIFSLTLILALAMRRGFCSWVCPFGTASEWLHRTGKLIFGRNLSMPGWLDIIFRLLKYTLLGFFLYYILLMPVAALRDFIHGYYNRIADIKMYLFFSNITNLAISVIIVIGFLSLFFKNFFCRYLCPYGALLGLFSVVSPVKVRRNLDKCTACGKCGQACPNRIMVDKKKAVYSVECTACFDCVEACEVDGAIAVRGFGGKLVISAVVYGVITVAAFLFAAQIATAVGYWQSETSVQTYRYFLDNIAEIGHP